MDDFSIPGVANAFGLWPSPCMPPRSIWLGVVTHSFHLLDNYPQPGKRSLSSTAPTILEDESGEFLTAIGASGGSRIFPAIFQVLVNLDWGLDASAAVEFGRVHDQLFPMIVDTDNVYPSEVVEDLRQRGHNMTSAYCVF